MIGRVRSSVEQKLDHLQIAVFTRHIERSLSVKSTSVDGMVRVADLSHMFSWVVLELSLNGGEAVRVTISAQLVDSVLSSDSVDSVFGEVDVDS